MSAPLRATPGYPPVASSDAHLLRMVGRAYTDLTIESADTLTSVTAWNVVAALKNGSTAIYGRRQPIYRSVRRYLVGASRKTSLALKRPVAGSS